MSRLPILYAEIEQRVRTIASGREWPCRSGCANCCRSLSEPMNLTRTEWRYLEVGLAALSPSKRAEIRSRLNSDDRVCSFLDPATDRCMVYEHRPAACRTYGFYVTDGHGTWCDLVEQHTVARAEDSIVFGHHDGVQHEVTRIDGDRWSVHEWAGQTDFC